MKALMRSRSSCLLATRMWRSTERAILEKYVSTQLSHDACLGVNTNLKRLAHVSKKRRVSRERWAEWLSSSTQISRSAG